MSGGTDAIVAESSGHGKAGTGEAPQSKLFFENVWQVKDLEVDFS